MKKVSVVTSSTGSIELKKAAESVLNQDYRNTQYILVADGPKYHSKVKKQIKDIKGNIDLINLPQNTGANGIGGYRVYTAFSFLVDSDYICFLDEDNWLDSDHISSLVKTIESKSNLDWCYSLRKIYTKDEEFLFNDDCESLGRWPVWNSDKSYHVDIGAYFFKTEFVRNFIHTLNKSVIGDRVLLYHLLNYSKENFECSKKYSLNYRLGGNPGSVTKEFFEVGNQKTKEKYSNRMPWM